MSAPQAIAALTLMLATSVGTQQLSAEPTTEDPIEAAIRAFNNRDRSKPNEVTVVLDPPAPPINDEKVGTKEEEETATAAQDPSKPVLVTGKPPKNSAVIDIEHILSAEPKPDTGLHVRIENVKQGSGQIDPSQVELNAPFPAKPLGKAPEGWKLITSDTAPSFERDIELEPGKSISLTIRPHLLVPDANGSETLAVAEPGFRASLGYRQSDTVSAVLSTSILQHEEDTKAIGKAIDQLQQLLISLPKPDDASTSLEAKPTNP